LQSESLCVFVSESFSSLSKRNGWMDCIEGENKRGVERKRREGLVG